MPPQAAAMRGYFKKMLDEVIPTVKAELSSEAISKEDFIRVIKEVGAARLDVDVLKASVEANPAVRAGVPPPLQGLMMEAVDHVAKDVFANLDGLAGAMYDLFAVGGVMTQPQLDAVFTLFFHASFKAQDKFDKAWAMLDADGDGMITKEEGTAFAN